MFLGDGTDAAANDATAAAGVWADGKLLCTDDKLLCTDGELLCLTERAAAVTGRCTTGTCCLRRVIRGRYIVARRVGIEYILLRQINKDTLCH